MTKKPPRTEIPRTVRRKFVVDVDDYGGVLTAFFDQDAVEQAMQEITVTVQGAAESERMWRALASAQLAKQRKTWKKIRADRLRNADALRRLAELVVLGRVVLAKPGGRKQSDHREAWLTKYDEYRTTADESLTLRAVCKQMYDDDHTDKDDKHDEAGREFQIPVGDGWRPASFDAVYRYIKGKRKK